MEAARPRESRISFLEDLFAAENKGSTVYLLSIRRHRQLSLAFASLLPGAGHKDM